MNLSEEFKEKLAPIKKRLGQEQGRDQFLEGPVFITEDTCNAVRAELGMLDDPKTRDVLRSINPYLSVKPFDRGFEMAEEYFQHFKTNENPNSPDRGGILYQISGWLDKRFESRTMTEPQNAMLKNVASIGMAVVISAFHRQCGPEFLDRLKYANPRDIMIAFDEFGEGNFAKDIAIIERVKKSRLIPSDQVFLKTLVMQLSSESSFHPIVEDGAVIMYRAIKMLWPRLKTPTPTSNK